MQLEELTPAAEKLLQEILDNRLDNGDCNMEYWDNRFKELSFPDYVKLRESFAKLSDTHMILVKWASGGLFDIIVLNNGLAYFDIKEENEKEKKKYKYSQLKHDILLLAIGVLFGGIVEFLLFKLFGIGG